MNLNLPLALLHGWGQHGGIWQQLLERLYTAAAPADTCNFDLPGHGAAPAAPYVLDALVDHYAHRAPAECVLVGWSLGGMLALRWAQRHPQQVKKLILFSTTPCFGARPDWPHGAALEVQQAFAAQIAAAPERGLQRFADLLAEGEHDVRGTRRALRAHLAAAPVPATESLAAGLQFLAATDLRAELLAAPPPQPLLLIHGEADTITPFAAALWLAAHLPQARLHALAQCGHAPMLSHASEAAAVIQAFLDESA
jgi:pimeloyl-[acyl-carrier protein] methyl ester esterase